MDTSSRFLKIILWLVVAVVAIALALFFGRQIGKKEGVSEVEANLRPVLEKTFPTPAPEIHIMSGIVKAVYGGTINFEVSDPNDYIPHADGSAPRKEVRYVGVTSATKISLADLSKIDRSGNIVKTIIALSSLKNGDGVTIKSATNIKDAVKFDATEIELVKY